MKWRRILMPLVVGLAFAMYQAIWNPGTPDTALPYRLIASVRSVTAESALPGARRNSGHDSAAAAAPPPRVPVGPRLVTDTCATATWPALADAQQRWTAVSVAAAVGRVSQVKASAGTQFTYFDHAQPWAELYDPDYMPGGDVDAACILLKQGCEETSAWTDHTRIDATRAYYYKTIKVSSLDESLQQQVAPLDCLAANVSEWRGNVWLSSANVSATLHYDTEHNVLVQLVGRKRVTLFPPSQHKRLYLHSALHPSWRQSRIARADSRLLNKFPFYDNVTAFQVELEPGQVLYMPPFWFHHVTALTPSVSLNVWSTSRAGVLSEAVQDVALPFDARAAPDELAQLSRSYLLGVLNAVFAKKGGAAPLLEDMLASRYVEHTRKGRAPPPSAWLQFLSSDKATGVRTQLLTDTPLKRKLKDSARTTAKLLGALPYSIREIVALDHVEQVAWFVVRRVVDGGAQLRHSSGAASSSRSNVATQQETDGAGKADESSEGAGEQEQEEEHTDAAAGAAAAATARPTVEPEPEAGGGGGGAAHGTASDEEGGTKESMPMHVYAYVRDCLLSTAQAGPQEEL